MNMESKIPYFLKFYLFNFVYSFGICYTKNSEEYEE